MDEQSTFFTDSVPYEDSNTYQHNDHDGPYGVASDIPHDVSEDIRHDIPPDMCMDPGLRSAYQGFDDTLCINQSSMPGGGPTLGEPPGIWDGFAEPSALETNNNRCIDSGMYGGKDEGGKGFERVGVGTTDNMAAHRGSFSDAMSRLSTQQSSSNKSNSHRSSKSGSSMCTDITPPDEENPPKRRKTRKKDANTEEDEHRRNKFLERNRLAASKCREKKKQYTQELEGTKIRLETLNAKLHREYNQLQGEANDLKHQLMAHAKCHDPNIDLWLGNEARRFVQTNESFSQQFPTLGQTGPASGVPAVPGSPRSRHGSIAESYPQMTGVQLGVLRPGAEGQGGGGLAYGQSTSILAPSNPNPAAPAHLHSGSGSDLYPTPGGASGYSNAMPPGMKREPDINYDHMPDDMFSDQSTFGSG